MSGPAIEAIDLRRTYRIRTGWLRPRVSYLDAVRGISFAVDRGELFGLLGPNGAGKTTTIKMLNTLLVPSGGNARILGHDVVTETRKIRGLIGYVFGGDRGLYDRLSAFDNLRYFADLYGVPAREQHARIGELLELVGLAGRERERVEGYSRGMRQRLHIARGLLHRPRVLFLDEPSLGLDPVAARELRSTIAALADAGTTILMTTHYMADADELCDRIAVIADGELRALGTPLDLKWHADDMLVVDVEAYGVTDAMLDSLRRVPGVCEATVQVLGAAHLLTVRSHLGCELERLVLAELDGIRLGRVTTREPTLEDAYVAIVARAGEDVAA